MATNDKSKRGSRSSSATTPAVPTNLPAEKITARPSTESEAPGGNVRETAAARPSRDLRAQRAAERAARLAAASGSAAPTAETTGPTIQPTTPAAQPASPTTATSQLPAERINPAVQPATPANPPPAPTALIQLPAERITPRRAPTAARATPKPTPAPTAERATPRRTPTAARAARPPAPATNRATPKPTVQEPATALPPERIQRQAAVEPEHRGHRTATSHSNPTMRTLPGERISPRRPTDRVAGRDDNEDSGFEPRTYTASELRQEQEERRATELLHPGKYWYRMDLHCHTPRSTVCYREPNASYLRILQKAEERGVDILAFTDHNTVAGYAELMRDREHVELMEREGRLTADERYRLEEYRRIFSKLLVLPGFEFSATFGFHILCIFPPTVSTRRMEYLLMSMGITEEKMLLGSPEVGATTDVLNVYRAIAAEGGICIGAHANSSNGIVMNGFNFGGQTKIAYTQDPNLAALEVTDLDSSSRRSTPSFFNGSKPEYPRRMHCIQSSDSHRIYRDPDEKQRILGVGDRTTDMLLPELSFAALKALFFSSDWERIRPSRQVSEQPFDAIKAARTLGANQVQAFHDRLPMRRMSSHHILRDVAAFANTNGGTIYLGVPAQSGLPLRGVDNPSEAIDVLRGDIQRNITPPLNVSMDMRISEGKSVVLVNVPKGAERPYALEGSQIYIRQESETNLAMRDEIVQLVRDVLAGDTGETVFAPRPAQAQPPSGNGREERRFERRERFIPAPREEQPASLPQPQIASSREIDAVASPPASISQPAPQVEPALVALAAPSLAAATIAAEPDSGTGAHPEESSQTAIGEEQTGAHRRNRRKRGRGQGQAVELALADEAAMSETAAEPSSMELGEPIGAEVEPSGPDLVVEPPHTGVEIVASEERDSTTYHTMKDLRNGNLVHHVSRHSARRLWRYAITQREHNEPRLEDITWLGDIGLWRSTVRADMRRYDLAQRDAQGNFHAYYGVTEEGLHGPWLAFTSATPMLESEDEAADAEQAATADRAATVAPNELPLLYTDEQAELWRAEEDAYLIDLHNAATTDRDVSTAPTAQSELRYSPDDLNNIGAFADIIEQHFNRMDNPHERALALTAHGHEHLAYAAPTRRAQAILPAPGDEQAPTDQQPAVADETPPSFSVFDEATLVPEMVPAHTAAEERAILEQLAEFEQPTYLPPEQIGDYIVVIDSADVPEAAEVSDDGATPPLAEARDAWAVAVEPEKRSRNRGGRGKRAPAQPTAETPAPPSIVAPQSEPLLATEAAQPEPMTVIEAEQAVEQVVERLTRQSRSRNRRPTQAQAQAEAQPETQSAAIAAPVIEAQPKPGRARNRKGGLTAVQAQAPAEAQPEAPAPPSEPAIPTESKPGRSNPRRRNGPSDLRRGRDEDPANPDIAPIPQLASIVEPYEERD
jgi:Putative DNA-binding domain